MRRHGLVLLLVDGVKIFPSHDLSTSLGLLFADFVHELVLFVLEADIFFN